MATNTAKFGLPYLQEFDALASLDESIAGLAARLDLLLGEVDSLVVNVTAANTNQTQRVNFARSYSAPAGQPAMPAPIAIVCLGSAPGAAGNVAVWSSAHDATGFTLGIRSGAAGNHTVRYAVRF